MVLVLRIFWGYRGSCRLDLVEVLKLTVAVVKRNSAQSKLFQKISSPRRSFKFDVVVFLSLQRVLNPEYPSKVLNSMTKNQFSASVGVSATSTQATRGVLLLKSQFRERIPRLEVGKNISTYRTALTWFSEARLVVTLSSGA